MASPIGADFASEERRAAACPPSRSCAVSAVRPAVTVGEPMPAGTILRNELNAVMALAGTRTLAEIRARGVIR